MQERYQKQIELLNHGEKQAEKYQYIHGLCFYFLRFPT